MICKYIAFLFCCANPDIHFSGLIVWQRRRSRWDDRIAPNFMGRFAQVIQNVYSSTTWRF